MSRVNQFKRFNYYFFNILGLLIPRIFFRMQLKRKLSNIEGVDIDEINTRVAYYNQTSRKFFTISPQIEISKLKKTKGTTYFFDLRNVLKYFPSHFKFSAELGDVKKVPSIPSFLKSRPISEVNQNSVLLKLNKIRHFNFIKDKLSYKNKKNMVAWRGVGYQPHRIQVIKQFYDHKMCNIGQTKPYQGKPWEKDYMSIEEQLQYKFLLCIEGNDVATNLKWVMSSNSLCLMSKPKFETWFMEGRLESGVHYVELQDDYSDLIEMIEYYLVHEEAALTIIKNANEYVKQFKDEKQEQLISLYFKAFGNGQL